MRYHYQKPIIFSSRYGQTYSCENLIYDCCTLYLVGNRGLAVIQQRFNPDNKTTYWTNIDPWLVDQLYLNPKFMEYFNKYAKTCTDGLYPTVTVRQIMHYFKMKPIKREPWETTFDHCPV